MIPLRVLFYFSVLVFTIFYLFKNYWKLHLMYNPSLTSSFTPKHFQPTEYKSEYDRFVQLGFQKAAKSSVVICSLLRDVHHKMPEIIRRAEGLGSMFNKYYVVVVENNSTDGTREDLLAWSKKNPAVTVLGCGVNVKECNITFASTKTEGHAVSHNRINKMSHLRNIYLDYLRNTPELSKTDFVFVVDLDLIGNVYLDGVANSLGHMSTTEGAAYQAAGVCANGVYKWPGFTVMYDTYAFLDLDDEFDLNTKTFHDIKKGFFTKHPWGHPPVLVKSCFGGFTIYDTKALLPKNVMCGIQHGENIKCEHVLLHEQINKNSPLKSMYHNPGMINLVALND